MLNHPLRSRLAAELVGTAGLLAAVVGSGVMAQRLTDDVAVQLLVNALATVAVLGVLISSLGPVSGAHFNPAVTVAQAVRGEHLWGDVGPYVAVQVVGAVAGTALANLMFGLPALHWSTTSATGWDSGSVRSSPPPGWSSPSASCAVAASRPPLVVPAWILGAYFFTSSTSFANPAVTIGRAFSDTFAGIAPASVPAFAAAQLVGVGAAPRPPFAVPPDSPLLKANPHE